MMGKLNNESINVMNYGMKNILNLPYLPHRITEADRTENTPPGRLPSQELEKIDIMLKSTKYNNRNRSTNLTENTVSKAQLEKNIKVLQN
jgi:hypothetical protein